MTPQSTFIVYAVLLLLCSGIIGGSVVLAARIIGDAVLKATQREIDAFGVPTTNRTAP